MNKKYWDIAVTRLLFWALALQNAPFIICRVSTVHVAVKAITLTC